MKNWSFIKHFISCTILSMLLYTIGGRVLPINKNGGTVGIIGGADGPTVIYTTGPSLVVIIFI